MSDWRREKAELLARQYTPGVKNKYWSGRVKDLADGIEATLKEAEERSRHEENEACLEITEEWESSLSDVARKIRARLEEK